MTALKVQVTQEHIDLGTRSDSLTCPIALALKTLGYTAPIVNSLFITLDPTAPFNSLLWLSQKVVDWLEKFDDGKKVPPFEFELSIPD